MGMYTGEQHELVTIIWIQYITIHDLMIQCCFQNMGYNFVHKISRELIFTVASTQSLS